MRLQGNTFLITGGGAGLGAACVHEFTGAGANVIIADVNAETGERLAREVGAQTRFVRTDVTSEESVRAAFEQALGIFREMGNLKGEGWTLNNLGKTCSALGQQEQAREYLEQAFLLRREVDPSGAGRTLNNLGAVYAETHTERGTQWVVMTNPEGNEFCVAQVE